MLNVLPLGVSHARYQALYGTQLDGLGTWTFSEVGKVTAKARERIREHVPKLMTQLRHSRMGKATSLLESLQCDGFNPWWFLEISEKSAYRGLLINRMYDLALVQSILDSGTYQRVWICLEDQVLGRVMRDGLERLSCTVIIVKSAGSIAKRGVVSWMCMHLRNALGVGMLHLLQRLLIFGLRIPIVRLPPPHSLLFFTFYPRMWSAPYQKEASEWFFGALPNYLPTHVPHYYAIWLTAWPGEIWKKRKELRSFFLSQKAFLLAPLVGLKSLMGLLGPRWWMLHVLLSDKWLRSAALRFGPFDVGEMVGDELHRSLASSEFSRDLLLVHAWRRLTTAVPVAAVLYRLEFQPFENAILYGSLGRTRTIAFQHSIFGKNYLPYHFNPGEFAQSSVPGSMPLPDVILVSGEYGRAVMLRNGYSSKCVEVCGPLRYRSFFARVKQQRGGQKGTGVRHDARVTKLLVVATSVSRPDAEGLLEALAACVDALGNTAIVFRSHPALPLEEQFEKLVGSRLARSQYRFLTSTEELYDALALADGAVMNHSTVMIEALELGVVPIIFESGAVYDPKAFESDEWAGVIATNAEELGRWFQSVMRGDDLTHKRYELLEQGRDWFDRPEVDPYQRFIDALNRHGIVTGLGTELVEKKV